MIRKKHSGVNSWIAANGGRDIGRQTLTYMAREVSRIPLPLLRLLVVEFDSELPDFADARKRVEGEL